MRIATGLVWLVLCLAVPATMAENSPLSFEDEARQQRYKELLAEIRCLVCQNQSLADSPAGLAQDLRREIHTMIAEGKNNEAIVEFLVARYGDFILYKPPLKRSTWLLWFGPFILLLTAAAVVIVYVRRSRRAPDEELSRGEHERAARLLEDNDK